MFDASEPWAQAERIAADRDRFLSRLPECSGCGDRILGEAIHFPDDTWYCRSCIAGMTEFVELEDFDEPD